MLVRINNIGTEYEYGREVVIAEDEQIGDIKVRELHLDSLDELKRLLQNEDVDVVEVKESMLGRYDLDLNLIDRH